MKKANWEHFPRDVQKIRSNSSRGASAFNRDFSTLKSGQSRGHLLAEPDLTPETLDITPQFCIHRRSQESRARLRLVTRKSRSSLRSLSPSRRNNSGHLPLGEVPAPQQAFTTQPDFSSDIVTVKSPLIKKQRVDNQQFAPRNEPEMGSVFVIGNRPATDNNLSITDKAAVSDNPEPVVKQLAINPPSFANASGVTKVSGVTNETILNTTRQFRVGTYMINLGSQIGTGGYSSVFEVTDAKIDRKYALKVVNFSKNVIPEIRANLLEEVRILESLRGVDHVIQLLAYDKPSPDQIQMLIELGQGDLNQILQKCQTSSKNIDTDFVRYWGGQVLRAVAAVHDHNIVHADLKPHNFVIVNGSLKLIDFGIANPMPSNATSVHRDNAVGTLLYMAPETLRVSTSASSYKVTKSSDIWSCGVILFEMIYQKHPYDKFYHYNSENGLLEEVKHPTETPFGSPVPLVLHEVIRDCLLLDPHLRTTARRAADGPFFTPVSVDLKALVSMSKSVYKYCNGKSDIPAEEAEKLETMAGTLFQKLIRFNNGRK